MRPLRATASPPPPSSRRPEGNLSRLAGSAGALFAGGWMAYALSTLFQIIVARNIGAHEFGAYIVGVGIAWVLAQIAPFGMTWAVVRYVALYRSQDDVERLRGTVWLGARVTAAGGAILGAGMFLAAPVLASRVLHDPEFTLMLRLLSLSVPLSALTELGLATVQAHTRVLSTVLVRSVVVPALRLVGALGALALWGGGALTVAAGYLTAELVAFLLAAVSVLRVLPLGPAARSSATPGRWPPSGSSSPRPPTSATWCCRPAGRSAWRRCSPRPCGSPRWPMRCSRRSASRSRRWCRTSTAPTSATT